VINPPRLAFVTRIPGIAGPASFQRRMAAGLRAMGMGVGFDLQDRPYDAVLVIGATRALHRLWQVKREGIPIVHRLNGMNWIHRVRRTGMRHFLRAEVNNRLLRLIRDRFADQVIYQSRFAQQWWEREFGLTLVPSRVVYNGVPLDQYHPEGSESPPRDRVRILVVEGNFRGGYEHGLEAAVGLAEHLKAAQNQPVELALVGSVSSETRRLWDQKAQAALHWEGVVEPDLIPGYLRGAHMLYAADVHPACPNAVLEAMACGLPVVAFNTGALPELIDDAAGLVVPYGADAWRLEPPAIHNLAEAALRIYEDQGLFRNGARTRAESAFGLDAMLQGYLSAFSQVSESVQAWVQGRGKGARVRGGI